MTWFSHIFSHGQPHAAAPADSAAHARRRGRRPLGFELLEQRRPLAADIHLGIVYYEDEGGLDIEPDVFEVTWSGGPDGAELTRLVIDTDVNGNGLLDRGETFFDTAAGGLGAFGHHPLVVIADGFTVTSITTLSGSTDLDGSMSLVLTFEGFTAGKRLVLKVDVDEMGTFTPNAVAEGNEFEGSIATASFSAPNYHDAQGSDIFLDFYDHKLAATGLNLPADDYSPPGADPTPVRTAGAFVTLTPQPLPSSISGRVHADPEGDCHFGPNDIPLAGVLIELLDAQGNVIRTTTTDADGRYTFDNLDPGVYGVREHQPAGYFDSGDHVGTAGGYRADNDYIAGITLVANTHGLDYNFCELLPSSISGRVHVDNDQNDQYDPGEPLLVGVVLELLDAQGQVIATTQTDALGQYLFDNLAPGTYSVRQIQPLGYIDSGQSPGSVGGTVVEPDTLAGIVLVSATHAVRYDFWELLPASIAGRVIADTNGNCLLDPGEHPIAGVEIHLLDQQGNVLAVTYTDALGRYRFDNLTPGRYAIREIQPDGYFDGGDHVGSAGGVRPAGTNDLIADIPLTGGLDAVNYDFCEIPPGAISGYVFQDGPAIIVRSLADELSGVLAELPAVRNGLRDSGDTPLAGVVLHLADADGNILRDSAGNLIQTVTDSRGYYEFTGLAPGMYSVLQDQPDGYYDGIDTPGSTGGFSAYPGDAILRITVAAGATSVENNFSEVLVVERPTLLVFPPTLVPPPPFVGSAVAPVPSVPLFFTTIYTFDSPPDYYGNGLIVGRTWHLSVVNGGQPRAAASQLVGSRLPDQLPWHSVSLDQSQWILRTDEGLEKKEVRFLFGLPGAIPVTGDFNGDGRTDIGVFYKGQWFIDLNGNGVWDDEDLWASLGYEDDLPVTGDWDGDGKTDIGVYGRPWPGDPQAIAAEPGIPTVDNPRTGRLKNPPPQPEHATRGWRTMQRTSRGQPRADLIDHVFNYGAVGDRPVAGDFNGDGISTIGVFNDGQWRLDVDGDGLWSQADEAFQMGAAGDIPVVGDFDGDGRTELGIFRDGLWHIDIDHNRILDARDMVFQLGGPGDLPVVGDFNGDGIDEPGVYQP